MINIQRTVFGGISSLFTTSLHVVAHNLNLYNEDIKLLPPSIKSKLLYILSKRGILSDANIEFCLHARLKEIDLSESDVTDEALATISKTCINLVKIDLNSAKESRKTISNDGIIKIARSCRWIQVFYLRRCLNIGDEAVVQIAVNCKSIKHLNLGGCSGVSDRSLQALAENCPNLESLNVSSTKVSDNGVFQICKGKCCNTLTEFHMALCHNITDEAIECIIEYCRKIRILIFHGCPKITENSRIALEELLARECSNVKQLTWTVY
ncbi:protein AMN1 homolog [Styela clava]